MNNSLDNTVSRRTLLAGAGLGVLALTLGNTNASALSVAQNVDLPPVELANAVNSALQYLKIRSTGHSNFSEFEKYVDPGATRLRAWERNRLDRFNTLSDASRWSAKFESVSSTPIIRTTAYSGGLLTLQVYEWISIDWRSVPKRNIVVSSEELELRAQYPDKYCVNLPSDRLINSGLGVNHQLTLAKSGNTWLIVSDGYEEPGISGISPDYSPEKSTLSGQNLKVAKPLQPMIEPRLTARVFDYQSAVAYALAWCGALGANNMTTQLYNAQYAPFPGSDCADFVSESFLAGGYPIDGTWFYKSISGTATTPSLTGTPTRTGANSSAWINNASLRTWLLNSGRGVVIPSIGGLGLADIVNYSYGPGQTPFHVMIVTDIDPNGNRLLSAHTSNQKNWSYIPGAYAPASGDLYTRTLIYYNA